MSQSDDNTNFSHIKANYSDIQIVKNTSKNKYNAIKLLQNIEIVFLFIKLNRQKGKIVIFWRGKIMNSKLCLHVRNRDIKTAWKITKKCIFRWFERLTVYFPSYIMLWCNKNSGNFRSNLWKSTKNNEKNDSLSKMSDSLLNSSEYFIKLFLPETSTLS